jgi:hypothetical protein
MLQESADFSNHLSTQNNNNDNTSISGVSFNEQRRVSLPAGQKENGWIMKLALKTGWVKNEKEANVALLILVVIIFILAIIVWPSGGNKISQKAQEQQQLETEAMIRHNQSLNK